MDNGLIVHIKRLRTLWQSSGLPAVGALPEAVVAFQARTGYMLPADLRLYFNELNGTRGKYDDNFFRFSRLSEFKSVNEDLRYWGGVPDYTGIVYSLPAYQDCFVLADWNIQCVTYAIRLHKEAGGTNEVYHLCGAEHQVVAPSFTDFIAAYVAGDLLT